MQFTPGQLRETVGISVETFRHWKRVLPPFANRKGYVPSFTIGDLLAARVLRALTESCGIRVGHLLNASEEIFRVCNSSGWTPLESGVLAIDLIEGTCRLVKYGSPLDSADILLRCVMKPILRDLRESLLKFHPSADQHNLLLPPVEVQRRPSLRRSAS